MVSRLASHLLVLFQVDVLSKLRHPNLVTLIGACSEAFALIYEYLPNGSLEDRLSCKDNTPPLTWQARIRIATELCSVLIFLHSSNPHSIVHGDLKPGNILLDANLACKLGDFGICRALPLGENPSNITLCHRTDPKGTFLYLDPHFFTTGELSPKSDTYSFGIILLQLLTGRPPFGIVKEVRDVVGEGNLSSLLDPLAGDWPFVQAKQLARLALRCCEMNRSDRPDLASEVWRVLEPMRASCQASSSFHSCSPELQQPPLYFICPILQVIPLLFIQSWASLEVAYVLGFNSLNLGKMQKIYSPIVPRQEENIFAGIHRVAKNQLSLGYIIIQYLYLLMFAGSHARSTHSS